MDYLSLPEIVKPEGWGTIKWVGFDHPPHPEPPNVHPPVMMMHDLFPWTEDPLKHYKEECRKYDILIDKIRGEFAYWESLGFDGMARFDRELNTLSLTLIAKHRGENLCQARCWSWEILKDIEPSIPMRNDFHELVDKISETDEVFRETMHAREMTLEEATTIPWPN